MTNYLIQVPTTGSGLPAAGPIALALMGLEWVYQPGHKILFLSHIMRFAPRLQYFTFPEFQLVEVTFIR